MHAEPQAEHHWLHKLLGRWTIEHAACTEPDQTEQTFTGTEVVRSLGGIWTIGEGEGEMPDGNKAYSIMTLGFDPARNRFVGSFVASVMTHFWIYDGALDADGQILTLDCEGPNFDGPGMLHYQDIIEFVSDDYRTLTSRSLGPDGNWNQFLVAHYRRAE